MSKDNFVDGQNSQKSSHHRGFSIYFLSRRIDFMTMEEILKIICSTAILKKKLILASYNVHSFNLSMHMHKLLEYQDDADIARCDGVGIIKGLKLVGIDIPLNYKISGTELIPKLIERCNRDRLSVFLLGAKPEILTQALSRQQEQYPNLEITGHHGYFNPTESSQNNSAIEQINRFAPDILLVGMGMPTQEIWIQKNQAKINARVIIPCGAVIDRLAGIVSTPPKWVSNLGVEWLYRLIKEPKRLSARYLLGNPLFLLNIIWAKYNALGYMELVKKDRMRDFNLERTKVKS
jgi:N-acetylglucosaminyldiphosphoundecaprenol N-acetyl-beta-D-mannosaminyltransferase